LDHQHPQGHRARAPQPDHRADRRRGRLRPGPRRPLEEEEVTEEREITEQGPEIIDFATEDLAVIPPTCNDLQKAQAVTVRLRLSKDKLQEWVDEGVVILPANSRDR
jgi:hypothetical protein